MVPVAGFLLNNLIHPSSFSSTLLFFFNTNTTGLFMLDSFPLSLFAVDVLKSLVVEVTAQPEILRSIFRKRQIIPRLANNRF